MTDLELLRPAHASAIFAFELINRAYFATSVSDRGDAYFDRFTERYTGLLAEQGAGIAAFYVLSDKEGSILGRFNLVDIIRGGAEVGYRVAEHAAGRGVATAAVQQLCRLAATDHGLRTLRAATSRHNLASQKVLTHAGFHPTGPADPSHLGGKPGTWYERQLPLGPPGAHQGS